ncbi:MAG: hypothetical protein AB1595_01475 [bacterium]
MSGVILEKNIEEGEVISSGMGNNEGGTLILIIADLSRMLAETNINEVDIEIHRHNHWSFSECREYFNLDLCEYLYFGGYPGAIPLRKDEVMREIQLP